jgi:hypothetical protein
MESFDFIHSGSFEVTEPNKHFDTLATKLKDFKNWKTIDLNGLRSADDDIVFIMYRDESGNFKQYNLKSLVEAYKSLIDDLDVSEKQWNFYDEVQEAIKPQQVDSKNLRFLDNTLTFIRNGNTVKRYITFNIAEKVTQK